MGVPERNTMHDPVSERMPGSHVSPASRRSTRWVLLSIFTCLLPMILSVCFMAEPLARDQGYFAFGGWRILDGDLPYRDFWANTFPGVFWYYALLEFISGDASVSISLGNGAIIGLTAFLITAVLPGIRGIAAGLLYGISSVLLHRFWDIGQAEQLVNLCMILSFYASRRSFHVVSGLAFSIAVLCKPISLLFIPIVVTRRIRWLMGAAVPPLLFITPYIVSHTVTRIYDDLIRFNSAYGGSRWDSAWMLRTAEAMKSWVIARYPLVILGVPTVLKKWMSTKRLCIWCILAIVSVIVQAKYFSYHWIPVLLPLSMLAGYGIVEFGKIRFKYKSVLIICLASPMIIFPHSLVKAWYPAFHEARIGVQYLVGRMDYETYLEHFGDRSAGADFVAVDQHAAICILNSLPPGELLVWGFEPGINYLSRRTCDTRFVVDFPLTFGDMNTSNELRSKYRRELLLEIENAPPHYIVIVSGDANPVEPFDSETQLRMFDEFNTIVRRSYRVIHRAGYYRVMRFDDEVE